jgi:hypothetical protein
MSKLAGGSLGTDLESLVGMGDTSVPGIEMSDLNDGDILSATRENVNPNGLFQFVYTGIDPPITSDWVDQEHKKKLTRQWVDGVKEQLIARATAGINEAKQKQLEERARRIRDEQFAEPVPAEPMVTRGSGAVQPRISVDTANPAEHASPYKMAAAKGQTAASDPASYVEDQLEMTRERLRAAEEAQRDITREVVTARRDYEKWKALAAALDSTDDDDGDGSPAEESAPVRSGGSILLAGKTGQRHRIS